MIILSSLNLGDTVMQDYQDKISQIDTTDSAQVNATIVSVVTGSNYIELGKKNHREVFTHPLNSNHVAIFRSNNGNDAKWICRGKREIFRSL